MCLGSDHWHLQPEANEKRNLIPIAVSCTDFGHKDGTLEVLKKGIPSLYRAVSSRPWDSRLIFIVVPGKWLVDKALVHPRLV